MTISHAMHEAATVKLPYLRIGLVLILLAVSLIFFRFPQTVDPVAHHAQDAASGDSIWRHKRLLLAAIVGGAILPVIEGRVADTIGIHHAFFIPVICYLYIAGFGFVSRAGSRTALL